MSRSLLERRLTDLTARMRALREELGVADEQLAALAETAEEAQLRALVSETPLADRESEEAMARHRAEVLGRLGELERAQDDLLDRLLAESK
jgi:hypothetical protein